MLDVRTRHQGSLITSPCGTWEPSAPFLVTEVNRWLKWLLRWSMMNNKATLSGFVPCHYDLMPIIQSFGGITTHYKERLTSFKSHIINRNINKCEKTGTNHPGLCCFDDGPKKSPSKSKSKGWTFKRTLLTAKHLSNTSTITTLVVQPLQTETRIKVTQHCLPKRGPLSLDIYRGLYCQLCSGFTIY